jgi:DNA-binding FadR family transcriptional regulator
MISSRWRRARLLSDHPQISERRLMLGDPLPPERELAQLCRPGRSSVRALRMLESKGVIEASDGGSCASAPGEHVRIGDAIGARNAEREREEMRAHLEQVGSDIQDAPVAVHG